MSTAAEFIRAELQARDWTPTDLAHRLGFPIEEVNRIVSGEQEITPAIAFWLAAAFGTSAELWLNLERSKP